MIDAKYDIYVSSRPQREYFDLYKENLSKNDADSMVGDLIIKYRYVQIRKIKEKKMNTVKKILSNIKSDGRYYGIRVTYDPPTVGQVLPPSKDWDYENDCASDDDLDGTSSIGLGYSDGYNDIDTHTVVEALRWAGMGGKNRRSTGGHYGYPGDYVCLIAGNYVRGGDDEKEIILDSPIVVEVFIK